MGGYRSYRGGGGGGTFTMGLPPFTPAIKRLIIVNSAIFLLMLIVRGVLPQLYAFADVYLYLRPGLVTHGFVWQLVTYSFFHFGLFHILFNMLTLWMFGATLESEWGTRAFYQFYFFCVVGAALVTIGVAYAGLLPALHFLGISPAVATIGASGGIFGVMLAFAILHGNQEFMMFPLPFMIRAKYLVAVLVFIALVGALQGGGSVAYFAHLGGAFFGWIYVRFLPRRGIGLAASERYFGLRNSYYRWKRRRAARKFEVYMRQHDRSEYFDEHGNYRDPKAGNKGNGEHRGPWVQ